MATPQEVLELYGNRVRIRVCGLLQKNNGLLMVNHKSLAEGDFWSPPGGGVNFGEPAAVSLEREFYEETGLMIEVSEFLFACEFIQAPLHAVELFFKVNSSEDDPITGTDPEMKSGEQLIQSVKFLSWENIRELPAVARHGIFNKTSDPSKVMHLNGYMTL